MMRSIFGRQFGIGQSDRLGRNRKARSRRLEPSVDGLERRNLMTVAAGSVTLSAGLVTVTPAPTGPNAAVVSYQKVAGVTEVDVNLNGTDNYFALGSVLMVEYKGSGVSGSQSFQNETGITTEAFGGSGANTFTGGSGIDVFVGGSGSNTFNGGSGYDTIIGGSGTNVYNESATGSGIIIEEGSSNNIDPDAGSTGHYTVL